jgi:glycogen debranching enzyme
MFDKSDAFQIKYNNVPPGRFSFIPQVDMRFIWKVSRPDYRVEWESGILRIARKDRLTDDGDRHPPWLGISVSGGNDFTETGIYTPTHYPKSQARKAMETATPYQPGNISGRIPARVPGGVVEVTIATGKSSDDAATQLRFVQNSVYKLSNERTKRISDIASTSWFETGITEIDQAISWARISLDNLVMNQRGLGIYAGYYWFTTYWGRDSFIVLPGALAGGMPFDEAKNILRSFATYQNNDSSDPRYGRVPNFVTVNQVQYASIDGTWWFVRALDEYWKRSGDDEFAKEMMPIVFQACAGALAHAVDSDGFLTHGDGETWMDGGGEAHPYSPRGNRAVEVQALFHRGLNVAVKLANRFGEDSEKYQNAISKLENSFNEQFILADRVIDHLDIDNSADSQHRPNGLLALMSSPDLFSDSAVNLIVAENQKYTITPLGVRSLNKEDPNYHPMHLNLDKYYYDEAYHNGDIWLWLSGSWVSALAESANGYPQTEMLITEILENGIAGSLREIRDGDPTDKDDFGGATSQAWSLSELLRNIVDDYAGISIDLSSNEPTVDVSPSLPENWPGVKLQVRMGEYLCSIELDKTSKLATLSFDKELPTWSFTSSNDWTIELHQN